MRLHGPSLLAWATLLGLAIAPLHGNAADPPEIVIGAPIALTGGFGEGGQRVVEGLQVAVREINEQGGIKALDGAKLKLVTADSSSNDPTQASSVTRRLAEENKAVVLVGAHASGMTLSAQVEAERAQVPIITTSYADSIVTRGYHYTFKLVPQVSTMFGAMLDYSVDMMKASGADPSRIAVVVGSDAGSQDMARVVAKMAADRHLTLLATVTYPSNLTDATPVVSAMLQNKPALVLMSGFTPDVILLVRTLRNVGLTMPITTLSGSISNDFVGASLGKAAENFMGVVSWNWDLPIDGEKAFVDRYRHDFPNRPYPPAAETLGEGYAIGWLIKAGLEKAGSADPKKLRDALAVLTLPSILPGKPIAFDDKGLNTGLVPVLVTWTNGELRTIWPQQYQTTKLKP